MKLAKTIESARVKQVIKQQVLDYFAEFYDVIEKHNIKLKNIHNGNETGISRLYVSNGRLFYQHSSSNKYCN